MNKWSHITVAPSHIHGLGVFAARTIYKGETIGIYQGEIITEEEADLRYPDPSYTLLFDLGEGRMLDGGVGDNPLKHINHSKKKANCESYQEEDEIHIIALTNIAKGEELLYDYNLIVDEPGDYNLDDH